MHAVRQRGTSLRGAFARVGPTTDEALLHRQRAVVSLYRSLLKLSSLFFDDVGSEYLQWRTREMFRRRQFERSHKCVNAYVKEARVARRRVQRAIDGDAKTITHILELAYGKRGRLKHVFQAHFNEVQAGPKRHRALTPPRTSTNTGARWPHNLRGYRQPLPPKITRLLELRSADVAYNRVSISCECLVSDMLCTMWLDCVLTFACTLLRIAPMP